MHAVKTNVLCRPANLGLTKPSRAWLLAWTTPSRAWSGPRTKLQAPQGQAQLALLGQLWVTTPQAHIIRQGTLHSRLLLVGTLASLGATQVTQMHLVGVTQDTQGHLAVATPDTAVARLLLASPVHLEVATLGLAATLVAPGQGLSTLMSSIESWAVSCQTVAQVSMFVHYQYASAGMIAAGVKGCQYSFKRVQS